MTSARMIGKAALLAGVAACAIGVHAADANPFYRLLHGGSPTQSGGSGSSGASLLSGSYTTPAAAAWQASGSNPVFPPMFEWDPDTIVDTRPISATDEMGLTKKVEQYRGGVLIATYGLIGGGVCNIPYRSDNPGTTASQNCGPFSQGPQVPWEPGDLFKVYAAVYKESLQLAPGLIGSQLNVVLTAGTRQVTVTSTHDIKPGDKVTSGAAGYLPWNMAVASIDDATHLTFDQDILANGTTSLTFYKDMDGITIEGVTQNINGVDVRPAIVYAEPGTSLTNGTGQGLIYMNGGAKAGKIHNLTIRNIDVMAATPPDGQDSWGGGPKSLIYIGNQLSGTTTFEDMRVVGGQYRPGGANGFLSGNFGSFGQSNEGTIVLNRVELAFNGGWDGPAHNAYFGEGEYAVRMTNSWSHDAVYGHLMKVRAPHSTFIANYFQGGLPQTGLDKSENYLLDLPCGGEVQVLDNIFTKGASGVSSNGIFMTYNTETGICTDPPAVNTVDFRHNTLIAYSKTYDGQHPIYPFYFNAAGKGAQLPGSADFPASSITMANNVFIGFVPTGNATTNYPWYGTPPAGTGPQLIADFSEISASFALLTDYEPTGDTGILGTAAYGHRLVPDEVRAKATFGAQDAAP